MAKFFFQGHGSFRITTNDGTVIYVDPFVGEGYDKQADLVLVTHQHPDHNVLELVQKKEDCTIIQNFDVLVGGEYKKLDVKGVTVEAVPAYNKNHSKDACVGYIITCDGVSIYGAGDTSTTKEMADLASRKLDYALLPIDGFYNMGPEEAAECAKVIAARHTIPIHMVKDAEALFDREKAELVDVPGLLVVAAGEEIEL